MCHYSGGCDPWYFDRGDLSVCVGMPRRVDFVVRNGYLAAIKDIVP